MRRLDPAWLIAPLLALTLTGSRATADTVAIIQVRVGFPDGNADVCKIAHWTPVAAEVELKDGSRFDGELVAETPDPDGATVRTPGLSIELEGAGSKRWFYTRVKLGAAPATVRVLIRAARDGRGKAGPVAAEFTYPRGAEPLGIVPRFVPPQTSVILAIGRVRGLDRIQAVEQPTLAPEPRNWQIVSIDRLEALPTHWTAYDGVDGVVLATGGPWEESLTDKLLADQTRRMAIEHWAEFGGHLVVSVFANRSPVSKNAWLAALLPATIDPTGTRSFNEIIGLTQFAGQTGAPIGGELAVLERKPHARVLIQGGEHDRAPAAVTAALGRGRITLLAFDTDSPPFSEWPSRAVFWVRPRMFDLSPGPLEAAAASRPGAGDQGADLAFQLANHVETFADVRSFSFTAVAGLILLCILLLGPVEYVLLRKVLGRMEWTWITFPLLVVGVVVGVWSWASVEKGRQVRVHKVDWIEVDLQRNKVYGTVWFSVFSPRTEQFTLGIAAGESGGPAEAAELSWLARPGDGARSYGRAANFAFFPNYYGFAATPEPTPTAELVGVPIHDWASKSFTGHWIAPLAGGAPLIANLSLSREGDHGPVLVGQVHSAMTEPLRECHLLYGDKVWSLGTLEPGKQLDIRQLGSGRALDSADFWVYRAGDRVGPPRESGGVTATPMDERLRHLLYVTAFHRLVPTSSDPPPNEYLLRLDLTGWLRNLKLDQAILIGVLDTRDGPLEKVNDPGSERELPCRLTPFEPGANGTMRQSTMIRVFVPVRD